jgi:hypothetical protein
MGITPYHGEFVSTSDPADSVTAASVAHALNSTFSDTEVEAALNALGTVINTIITRLETKGLIAEN